MKKICQCVARLFVILLAGSLSSAQQPGSLSAAVPRLVNFSGNVRDAQSKAAAGLAGVTFAIYGEQAGGAPLWTETQTVTSDERGNYTAQLGATKSGGLPLDLFSTSEARWLGVRINGGEEQPRVLLVSVPYALRAGDAETIGGLPPSAFVLATPAGSNAPLPVNSTVLSAAGAPPASSSVTTTGGAINTIPLWTTSTNVQSSSITQTGTGTTTKIGINTKTPTTTLDVHGGVAVRGALALPAAGVATAIAGKPSEPVDIAAATFNSGLGAAVGQTFQLKAEPINNNTASPAATLNLLFGQGANAPSETGFRINKNGIVTFAGGQTFPGTGTITTLTAGTGLTGGGTGSNVTLNLDTTKVPQLNTANTFTGSQTVSGNLSATGVLTGSAFQIGSDLFAFGSKGVNNVFLGFAGNETTHGRSNTGVGVSVLSLNTTGSFNTAMGDLALGANTEGGTNTAQGAAALALNTLGVGNTAVGYDALFKSTTGDRNSAVGIGAMIENLTGTENTATGDGSLGNNTGGSFNTADGTGALGTNTSGTQNTGVGTRAGSANKTGSGNTFVGDGADASADGFVNATAMGFGSTVGESNALILGATHSNSVSVGIGTSTPFNDYGLTIDTTKSNGVIDGGMVVNASGGNLYLGMTNGVHKFRVDTNGEAFADGGFLSSGADFAESIAVRGSKSEYEPGDVLEIDRKATRGVALSRHPYATLVAGIYSTKPGLLATPHAIDDPAVKSSEIPLAVVGIVPCKVTAENGAILPGDLLVTSSHPGYAMKGTDRRRLVGAVVGKALEPLPKGSGVIQVLVTLQ